ncbi:MAG: nicotinate-nucleotide--dimethylbenzimidazole phosphoribosyltransferase [Candidatus Omnitrophica bacterium]|nr:nicotinate-nucleotide--dimethylbenzimidazole phosphoribosyltransferase [Candidatus Omnitrophota bacterium]
MNKIQEIIQGIKPLDLGIMEKTQVRLDNLTKPQGSLGRLEELAKIITGITGNENPGLENKVIFTLASDHGVTEEGISPYPKEVTAQMVYNFLNGTAGINVLSRHCGARVVVVDIGVAEEIKIKKDLIVEKINYGTKNMINGAAMSMEEAEKSIETGMRVFETELAKGINMAGTGEMGIGNTTASSAITACLCGRPIEEVTGRGAGLDDKGLEHKIRVINKALEINRPDPGNPIQVLSKIGGYEIGGLTGIILACGFYKIPVVIDGFISGAAALIAYKLQPKIKDYMIASHCSMEKGHGVILSQIGLKPLLDLGLRLGEGTGSALAMNIIEASVKILSQMATFKNAGVSERTK